MNRDLPEELIDSLQDVAGFDEQGFRAVHATKQQVASVRLNPAKTDRANSSLALGSKVPWSTHGYYLDQRPSFTADPLFHAGTYYVQEASSMFVEEAVKQTCDLTKSLRVLDLCAAPGGKSTLLQSIISPDSLLVSNDVIKTRANILAENISKWGAANVVVTNNDPKDFQRLPEYFDLIVVDAPCSGSGLFGKDESAIEEWSPDNVALCSQRQQRILADVLPALKPGGILIYSTCSYSSAEDEAICDWIIEFENNVENIRLKVNDEWNIVESNSPVTNGYGYRFYPDKLKGEGFFIAVFRKRGTLTNSPEIKVKAKLTLATRREELLLKNFVDVSVQLIYFKWKDETIAVPPQLFSDIALLQSCLYIRKAGIKAGVIIREELIPDHELAVSGIVSKNVASLEVDLENALQFLRRADMKIESALRGWVLIKYNGICLGWIKLLSNRINNYYPREWRILNK